MHGEVGLTAEAGAGKSTLVPWALLHDGRFANGRILHVLPRKLAVMTVAERIARLLGESPGQRVGFRTREATRVSAVTRLEVVTLGVALRMVQSDPTLSDTVCVILDEFHERHWQGDVIWAFLRHVRTELRPDLHVLLCSTHLPPELKLHRIAVPGRQFPVEIIHRPVHLQMPIEEKVAHTILEILPSMENGECLLAFLPGWGEIARCLQLLDARLPTNIECMGLHRASDAAVRKAVFAPVPTDQIRVVVATNLAETSVTLPNVTVVVDSGQERRFLFSPRTGLVHKTTVRISQVSATQRAGRAGRLRPGRAVRLWPISENLVPFAQPEILETDPLPVELELALWGPGAEPYFITPLLSTMRTVAATRLQELGFIDALGRATSRGRQAASWGVHPRISAMLQQAQQFPHAFLHVTACVLAALLEEDVWRPALDPDRVSSWVASLMERGFFRLPEHVRMAIHRLASAAGIRFSPDFIDPNLCARLLCMAYPDRVGRVDASGTRVVFVSGRAARISPCPPGTFVVAPLVDGGDTTGRIQLFEPCTLADVQEGCMLVPQTDVFVEFHGWRVRGKTCVRLGEITLEEKIAIPDTDFLRAAVREQLLYLPPETWLGGRRTRALQLRIRLSCMVYPSEPWPDVNDATLVDTIDQWLLPCVQYREGDILDDALIAQALWEFLNSHQKALLAKTAPEMWTLPSGRRLRVDYSDGQRPRLSSRLQDFFGCKTTPHIGGKPVVVELLSPAGRPVQVTSDLEGFWQNSYPLVRKEMAGRYPKHPWPQNP